MFVETINNIKMKKGTVKFFNKAKGFGFIKVDGSSEEVFVHVTGLADGVELQENDKVQFETEKGKKGVNAVNVDLI